MLGSPLIYHWSVGVCLSLSLSVYLFISLSLCLLIFLSLSYTSLLSFCLSISLLGFTHTLLGCSLIYHWSVGVCLSLSLSLSVYKSFSLSLTRLFLVSAFLFIFLYLRFPLLGSSKVLNLQYSSTVLCTDIFAPMNNPM